MSKSQRDYPRQSAQNEMSKFDSTGLFGSFDNTMSVSSSTTSVSSAWTSPNTSFSAASLATSVDASADGTDMAVRGPRDNPSHPPLLIHSQSGSESDVAKWYEVSTDKLRPPSDPMDLDSESIVINRNAVKAEPLFLQRRMEAKTSDTAVIELLTSRLHANSPFGSLPASNVVLVPADTRENQFKFQKTTPLCLSANFTKSSEWQVPAN